MEIRLAISDSPSHLKGYGRWEERWLEYCRDHAIPHEIVDCYASDVIARLRGLDGLLWHFCMECPTDLLMARFVLQAAEEAGLTVFPNVPSCWHYDDKIAQKYLFEAINAPLVPTYVFYDEAQALAWLKEATYPLVWKLRRGAGSSNVRLVESYAEARRRCRRAFGRGYSPVPGYLSDASTRLKKTKTMHDFWGKLGRAPDRIRRWRRLRHQATQEKGYVLFQEFIPDNACDTRIAVVGRRAWGFTRKVRKNDFRASGSGAIDYDMARVDPECVRIAFSLARTLRTQSIAFDFLKHPERGPLVVEMSYGYLARAVYQAPGYWEPDLTWHEGHFWPQDAVLEDLLAEIGRRRENEGERAAR